MCSKFSVDLSVNKHDYMNTKKRKKLLSLRYVFPSLDTLSGVYKYNYYICKRMF